jgi:hypothetical protein
MFIRLRATASGELLTSTGTASSADNVYINGFNSSFNTSESVIWEQTTETIHFPATGGTTVEIVSTSASDTMSVLITYLDNNLELQTIYGTLNGTTAANVTAEVFRVNAFEIFDTVGVNVGTVSVYIGAAGTGVPSDPATVWSIIAPGSGRAHQAVYTVPYGETFYPDRIAVSSCDNAAGVYRFYAREQGDPIRIIRVLANRANQTLDLGRRIGFTAGTDFWVTGSGDGTDDIAASIDVVGDLQ